MRAPRTDTLNKAGLRSPLIRTALTMATPLSPPRHPRHLLCTAQHPSISSRGEAAGRRAFCGPQVGWRSCPDVRLFARTVPQSKERTYCELTVGHFRGTNDCCCCCEAALLFRLSASVSISFFFEAEMSDVNAFAAAEKGDAAAVLSALNGGFDINREVRRRFSAKDPATGPPFGI